MCPSAPGRVRAWLRLLICPRAPIAGVNLLVGTENGLMLLDRSGQGKVYGLIGRRRFQQMDVLEGLNLLITISGVCVGHGGGDRARRRGLSSVALCHHLQPGQRATLVQEPEGGAAFSPLVVCRKGRREAESGSPTKRGCVCVCPRPSGKRNKLRVYYLSWLRNKILHNDPEVEKKQGWTTVGDMEGCGHYRVGEEVTAEWPGHVCF